MQALFIDGSASNLFAIYWPPSGGMVSKAILHIPAFAEEMNKSRRMVALQARTFAEQGYAVLVLDLFGTGESEGDFGEATWQIWLQNIDTAIDWLKQQGAQMIDLWGLRIGALLAMDFASRSQHPIERLIVWQPVVNGDVFITQFLRLRIAAAVMDRNAPQERTSELKQQLSNGKTIEVAGYLLNPDLIKPMLVLRANDLDLSSVKDLMLFEIVPSEDKGVSPANAKFIETLHSKNQVATIKTVVGSPFWSTQEIVEVPLLLTGIVESTIPTLY